MSRLARPLLLPLVPLFRVAVAAKDLAYKSGWVKPKHLRWPVVSVGSLSVGGAGKTPFVIHLAELLRAQGLGADVLSRGYGRSGKTTQRVDPDGTAQRFGDEPLLIARRTAVPVFVGTSRYRAGVLAEQTGLHPGIHILDDGFQHRELSRVIDIVLVGRGDLDDRLLPAGSLREGLSALRRAEILVVRSEEREIVKVLRARGFSQPVWVIDRQLEVPLESRRPLVFCGIARPGDFFAGVKRQVEGRGGSVGACQYFPDHHCYSLRDAEQLGRMAEELHADSFLTTEKDEVKLGGELLQALRRAAPVSACRLELTVEQEAEAIRDLLGKLALHSAIRLKPTAPFV